MLAEAAGELIEAKRWYDDRDSKAASAFARELDEGISAIADSPDRWPIHRKLYRRYLLRRFPFSIIYTFDNSIVTVIAVAHSKRRPGYWQGR